MDDLDMLDEACFVPDYNDTDLVEDTTVLIGEEGEEVTHSKRRKKQRKEVQCSLSLVSSTNLSGHLGRHVKSVYLTWYMTPGLVCWCCRSMEKDNSFLRRCHSDVHSCGTGEFDEKLWIQLVNGFIYFLILTLNMRNIWELMNYVQSEGLAKLPNKCSEEDINLVKIYIHGNGMEPEPEILNSLLTLFHWRTLYHLLQKLSSEDRELSSHWYRQMKFTLLHG